MMKTLPQVSQDLTASFSGLLSKVSDNFDIVIVIKDKLKLTV